jgi:catechol 2,3-dioxygenase-like lactoylglutathione lyase family enzyme
MGSRQTVMDHFGFKVRDIQSFIDKWEAAGLEMGRVFTGAEGQTNAYLTFPGGTYVELQEDQGLHEEVTAYHVHYFTPGYEELLNWYVDMFNLEVRSRGSIATTTNVPGMNISFGNSDTERAPSAGAAIDHIGFEIDNLEAFCKQLEARGVVFDRPYNYIESINLGTAFFTDPRGVVVELTEGLGGFF